MFDLAVIYAHIANDSDDVKLVYASFQAAAGVFSFIVENFLHAPSTDLSQDTVKAFTKLMLAQAQETFVMRFLSDSSSKPSMIAKLAKGASNLYKTAGDSLQEIVQKQTWGNKSWYQFCHIKAKYLLGIALENQSRHYESTGKYGESLSCLKQAVDTFTAASKLPLPSEYGDFASILSSAIEAAKHHLTNLEKDNDFIYHSAEIPFATLPELTGLEAAKPTPMTDLYKGTSEDVGKIIGRDIFEKLIPIAVHQKSSMYSEEKAKLLRKEGEKVEIADEELSSALEFLDLPASLRMMKDPEAKLSEADSIPSIVQEWAVKVSTSKAISFEKLETLKREIYDLLKAAESQISNEESEWSKFKMQYGTAWTQTTSSTLTSGIKGDIQQAKQSLSMGADSDVKIKELLAPYSSELNVLRSGPTSSALNKLYSFSSNPLSKAASNTASLLDLDDSEEETLKALFDDTEKILAKLQKISKERKSVFAEFKGKAHSDDISSLLVLNQKTQNIEETLFKSELEKFQPYQARIEASIHHQKSLLNDLTGVWKKVLSTDSVRKRTVNSEELRNQRLVATDSLKNAYNNWKDAQEGLKKGIEFYSNLKLLAESILNSARQFAQNRAEERSSIISTLGANAQQRSDEELRRQLSGLSVNSSYGNQPSGSAPQLPPKPGAQRPNTSQANSYDIYSQPSAYDPSLYGPSQQHQTPYNAPRYSYQQQNAPPDNRPPPNQQWNPQYRY